MPLTNRSASKAQLRIDETHRDRARAVRRMSSGRRITSARDDEAGIAIATRLSARGLNVAVRNTNDGIAMLDVADAAASGTDAVLIRMRELAILSASETGAQSDGVFMQTEVSNLLAELERITAEAEYNTFSLLDGTLQGVEFHVGAEANQTIGVSVGDLRPTALGRRATASSTALVDANALAANDVLIDGVDLGVTVAGDDTKSTAQQASSAIAKAKAVNAVTALTGVTATIHATTLTAAAAVTASSLAGGDLVINDIDIGAVNGIGANDGGGVLTSAINAKASATGVIATEDNGLITLTALDGRNIDVATGGAAATFFTAGTQQGSISLTSRKDFLITGSNASARLGVVATLHTEDVLDSLAAVDVSTVDGANSALAVIDASLEDVFEERTNLGAVRNRLERGLNSLHSALGQNATSYSRIMDADFARQTAELTRSGILLNAGVSILAQAVRSPTNVLSLIS